MSEPEVGYTAEVAHNIAADPGVVSSAVGALATEWAGRMAELPTAKDQQATTAAYYQLVIPEGATPASILRGDYGQEVQQAFLDGALMAAEQFMAVKSDPSPHSQ